MLKEVNMTVKESDVDIVLGSQYRDPSTESGKARFEEALTLHKFICCDLSDIRNRYILLGYHLTQLNRFSLVFVLGFVNLNEYAAANFGLDASMVSRCIAVFNRFCCVDPSDCNKCFIHEKFVDYSYSQLCEMVSMKNDLLNQCKPDMTVKELRELKKKSKLGTLSNSLDQLDKLLDKSKKVDFDIKKYDSLHGVARRAYMKKIAASSSYENVILQLHFEDGSPVPGLNNVWVNLYDLKSPGYNSGKYIVASVPNTLKTYFKEDKTS